MNAPLTPEQIEQFDKYVQGPARGNPHRARSRQVVLMCKLTVWLDMLIREAAEARIPAPGLLEMREWATYCVLENAAAVAPPLDIKPDAVKDALADATIAARRGDKAGYAAARQREAEARAAA